MTGFLTLYLASILLGCWAALSLALIGFALVSGFFALSLVAIWIAQYPIPLELSEVFFVWLLLQISYLAFGFFVSWLGLRRSASKGKPSSYDVQKY